MSWENGFQIPICSFLLVNVIKKKFCKDIVGKLSRVVAGGNCGAVTSKIESSVLHDQ